MSFVPSQLRKTEAEQAAAQAARMLANVAA
jgi:hypothetical protein